MDYPSQQEPQDISNYDIQSLGLANLAQQEQATQTQQDRMNPMNLSGLSESLRMSKVLKKHKIKAKTR